MTKNEDAGFLRQTPSAATTTGIVLGTLAVIGLGCMYCFCCMGKRKAKSLDDGATTTGFTRMNDDIPSSIGGGASVAGKSTKTGGTSIA